MVMMRMMKITWSLQEITGHSGLSESVSGRFCWGSSRYKPSKTTFLLQVFSTISTCGHWFEFHVILIVLIILMKRREVGVWILLLGRLQEAPPTKVGQDVQMPYWFIFRRLHLLGWLLLADHYKTMNYENGKSVMLMTNMTILDFSDNIDDSGHIFWQHQWQFTTQAAGERVQQQGLTLTGWFHYCRHIYPKYLPFVNIIKLWLILPS